jgi:hypothetical protein
MFDEAKVQIMASATPSTGNNLSGMAIDFDYYLLDRCPSLEAGTITTTSDPERLLSANCTARADARPSVVAEEIVNAWLADLRYPFREAHRLRQTPTTVEMDVATQTGVAGIFVTAQVVVRWPEQGRGPIPRVASD